MATVIRCILALLALPLAECKITRRYNFTISNVWNTGDGHGRPVFAINGQTPGPVIEADEGDEFEIFLDNQLTFETTMHWHGIYQIDRPWNDGVPGVTQYAVQSRDNYTYRFTVQQQYGSYFYHGHFGPSFADGMRGPIWIRPAEWRPRPYSLISSLPADIEGMRAAEKQPHHIIISDRNAEPMDIVMYRDAGIVPWCSNSLVLNSKSRTYCHSKEVLESVGGPGRNSLGCLMQPRQLEFSNELVCEETHTPLEVVQAADGQEWVWINFIHSGAHHEIQISVDEHEFYKVHAANCNLGERISILVHLNKKPGDYCHPTYLASPGANHPRPEPWVFLNGTLVSPSLFRHGRNKARPLPARPPPQTSDTTLKFFVEMLGASTWALNIGPHQAFRQQLPPVLWKRSLAATRRLHHREGHGWFPYDTVEQALKEGDLADNFNFVDPPNRDGCRLGNSTGDWTVIRYEISFPAASMLHCHMIHHFGRGQQFILEGVESMRTNP
ncbi:laccase TilA [Pseudomassariella vexata]|uniref:Laccase TilA n=1 Tax=Pseudomassariella vexata TaxID=1141098 RepID=A0A1Y2DJF2_9PEZI|nr:laccase TilA [Pseudomassariella vexata]ORY58925.1 laccase TilA [Pseudomassariella vexata]